VAEILSGDTSEIRRASEEELDFLEERLEGLDSHPLPSVRFLNTGDGDSLGEQSQPDGKLEGEPPEDESLEDELGRS
jgi:hypothetical protein